MNKEEIKEKLKLGKYRPRISTEDLYLVEFCKYECVGFVSHENWIPSEIYYKEHSLNSYTLAHKKSYDFYDAYTEKKYKSDTNFLKSGDIYVREVSQVVSNMKNISYKDAEEILETRNTLVIKK